MEAAGDLDQTMSRHQVRLDMCERRGIRLRPGGRSGVWFDQRTDPTSPRGCIQRRSGPPVSEWSEGIPGGLQLELASQQAWKLELEPGCEPLAWVAQEGRT